MAAVAAPSLHTETKQKRWHDLYPELGTHPLSVDRFTSPTYFERERECIFRRTWLMVAREEEFRKPGDYLMRDLPVANTSLLLVRGKDQRIRAFHNVCSHRLNKLVWNRTGNCQVFSCKFHGWSYNTEGRLTFVPDEDQFFDLNKEHLGLTPVTTDTWEGFVFVNLAPTPQETLPEYLGELGEGLQGYPFSTYAATRYAWRVEVQANWKVVQDAFQETYHVGVLHRRSLPDSFTSKDNPYSHSFAYKLYKNHRRLSAYGNPAHQPTPVEQLAMQFGPSINTRDWVLEELPAGVNPERSPYWSTDANSIFPNLVLIVFHGTYITHQFWPLAADRTLWEARTYYPQPQNVGQRFSQEYSKILTRDIFLEDASTVEATQSVLASGAKQHYTLQDHELLIRHTHKVIDDWIQGSNGHRGVNP